jgi:glycosyltransferase involved in cell wall biosynthesis
VPGARLTIVGKGSQQELVDELLRELPDQVEQHRELLPPDVAAAIDAARALVLPSWPEGLGRVVLEAFARGRTVVATDAGGIPDIVTNDVDGILIAPAATGELVAGLRAVLEDDALAARLGAAAHTTYGDWHQTAADFAQAYRELVDRALAGAR